MVCIAGWRGYINIIIKYRGLKLYKYKDVDECLEAFKSSIYICPHLFVEAEYILKLVENGPKNM